MITFQQSKQINQAQLLNLYKDAGWSTYTKNPNQLQAAIQNSLSVITAWHQNNLVGLIRSIGDGHTILYIQDLLVHTNFKRQGIGSRLLKQMLSLYPNVRQKVLLTDDTPQTRNFYSSNGFSPASENKLIAFVKI